MGEFWAPGAEIWLFKKKNMDRSIDLAVQHNDIYTIFWKWYDIRYHDISSNDMLSTGREGGSHQKASCAGPPSFFCWHLCVEGEAGLLWRNGESCQEIQLWHIHFGSENWHQSLYQEDHSVRAHTTHWLTSQHTSDWGGQRGAAWFVHQSSSSAMRQNSHWHTQPAVQHTHWHLCTVWHTREDVWEVWWLALVRPWWFQAVHCKLAQHPQWGWHHSETVIWHCPAHNHSTVWWQMWSHC